MGVSAACTLPASRMTHHSQLLIIALLPLSLPHYNLSSSTAERVAARICERLDVKYDSSYGKGQIRD